MCCALCVGPKCGTLSRADPPCLPACSNYNENGSIELALPAGMQHLEVLSVRADTVYLDWLDVCQRCEEVQVSAGVVVLGVGTELVARLVREVGYANLQVADA